MARPAPDASPERLAAAGLRLELAGPVATVVLDRAERRNAQTPAMWHALADLGRSLAGGVRVVVLRGAGRSFSVGLDRAEFPALAGLAARSDEELDLLLGSYQEAFGWLRRPDLVSIAAVHGDAVGAGWQLALACDLRLAAADARFTMAEVRHGLVPDLGGTKALVELAGYPRALELCLTGRRLAAAEAAALGLVELVVAPGELDAALADLVAALLAPPRDAVVETKALLARAAGRTRAEQLRAEREAQARRLRDLATMAE